MVHELKKWLTEPTGVSSMATKGTCTKTGKFIATGDIVLRLSKSSLVATDDVCYRLCGHTHLLGTCMDTNLPLHTLL